MNIKRHLFIFSIIAMVLLAAPQFSLAQAAATPVLRYKAVIDNLRNADTSNAQLDRITTRLLPAVAPNTNTSGWTNAQKASAILEFLRLQLRSSVQGAASDQERSATSVQNAINAAASDMD